MNCSKCGNCKGACPVTFGLALGLTCGFFLMIMAWSAAWFGCCTDMVERYSTTLSGYEATFIGGIFGLLWGLLKGFVFGFVLILFYRIISCCKRKCCSKSGNDGKCGCCGCCGSQECKK